MPSPHQVTPVTGDYGTCDVAGGLGAEEKHDAGHVLGVTETPQHASLPCPIQHLGRHPGGESARSKERLGLSLWDRALDKLFDSLLHIATL